MDYRDILIPLHTNSIEDADRIIRNYDDPPSNLVKAFESNSKTMTQFKLQFTGKKNPTPFWVIAKDINRINQLFGNKVIVLDSKTFWI